MQHAFELGFEWSCAAPLPPVRRRTPRRMTADAGGAGGGCRCHFPLAVSAHPRRTTERLCLTPPTRVPLIAVVFSPRHVSICGRFVRETNTRGRIVSISSAPPVASSHVHSLCRPPSRRHRHARQIGRRAADDRHARQGRGRIGKVCASCTESRRQGVHLSVRIRGGLIRHREALRIELRQLSNTHPHAPPACTHSSQSRANHHRPSIRKQ